MTIQKDSFKTASFSNITIIVGKTYDLPAKLEIGETTITVEVNGGGEQLIETQSAAVSSTIRRQADYTITTEFAQRDSARRP